MIIRSENWVSHLIKNKREHLRMVSLNGIKNPCAYLFENMWSLSVPT